jgi:hypothetical protein
METVGKLNIKCQHEKFPKEINATGTTPTNRIELSIRFVFEKLHALRWFILCDFFIVLSALILTDLKRLFEQE